jgi:hypothetical protein
MYLTLESEYTSAKLTINTLKGERAALAFHIKKLDAGCADVRSRLDAALTLDKEVLALVTKSTQSIETD